MSQSLEGIPWATRTPVVVAPSPDESVEGHDLGRHRRIGRLRGEDCLHFVLHASEGLSWYPDFGYLQATSPRFAHDLIAEKVKPFGDMGYLGLFFGKL